MMDECTIREIQREAADALLDNGISIPLKAMRLPFRRRPILLRMTMRRPTLLGQIAIARTYLSMNTTTEELENMTLEQQMDFFVRHGKKISRIIALTLCRGFLKKNFLTRLMTMVIHGRVKYEYQMAAVSQFVRLMGTDPFIPIIRSAERANPLKARLSQSVKGS